MSNLSENSPQVSSESPTSPQNAKKIELLPEHLVDQIKAGEVIERPASLIKEILENSIDAGAKNISLHLVANGMELISLEDDGEGMTFENLPYAFCRHATSKIKRFEDLYALSSYGFRGEALASVASISRVTCNSSPEENSPVGGKIVFHGGEQKSHTKVNNLRKGTSFYIKDLFYNTPARLKFIKSQISEKNAINRMIQSFLLANPQITFSIRWDDEDKEIYPAVDNHKKRVAKVFDKRKKDVPLYEFETEYEGHRIRGFLSQSSSKGGSYKKQFLFANKRIFTDRQIHQTILRGMDNLYPAGESGHYCLFIDVPPQLIDVNVHPNKTQIKFFKLPVITSLIGKELKSLSQEVVKEDESDLPLPHGSSQGYEPQGFRGSSQSAWQQHSLLQKSHDSFHSPISTESNTKSLSTYRESCDLMPITLEGQQYVLSKNRFLKTLFKGLFSLKSNPDKDFIPLLISEPFDFQKNSEQESWETLEKYGFQCERIDQETVVLRGIHQYLHDQAFVPHVLPEFFKSQSLPESFPTDSLILSDQWIKEILETDLISHACESFLCPLDASFYDKNFSSLKER